MEEIEWTTQEGKKILISEMQTSHIRNCIKMIDKYAKEGMEYLTGGTGFSGTADEMWADVCYIEGKDVYAHFGKKKYEALKNELTKRNEMKEKKEKSTEEFTLEDWKYLYFAITECEDSVAGVAPESLRKYHERLKSKIKKLLTKLNK